MAAEHPEDVQNTGTPGLKVFSKANYVLLVNYFEDLKAIKDHTLYEEVTARCS